MPLPCKSELKPTAEHLAANGRKPVGRYTSSHNVRYEVYGPYYMPVHAYYAPSFWLNVAHNTKWKLIQTRKQRLIRQNHLREN